MTHAALDRLDTDLDAALERLLEILRVRSISTDPAYGEECRKAAEWHAADLTSIGFDARVAETPGHPIVVADHDGSGPHVLFYGHYDVQPVDPLDLWTNGDPFEPRLLELNGRQVIHGRGASDDKGQLMTFVEACRALKATAGTLPCRVTILLEGEEESGGASLPDFLEAHRNELTADIALITDTGMWDSETPAITTMLRGNLGEQVTIHAASRDLHSGIYGGAAQNPIHVLTRILSDMHGDDGQITIPGFYEGVHEVAPDIKAQWDRLGFDADKFLGDVGLVAPPDAQDHTVLERLWSRPTAEVNGIWGGYTDAGFKTVIPAEAHAKVSFRLVGDQDPEDIRAKWRAYVEARVPAGCRATFEGRAGGHASVMPVDDPMFETARQALTAEWGREAAFIGCGGSIPVVELLKRKLGMDTILIGFGLEDDNIHSPNEKYDLSSFRKGARSWVRVLEAIGS